VNRILLRIVVAASLGGFLFGFDLSVISGTTRSLTDRFALDDWGLGLTVSSAIWATAVGALVSGWFAERFGRLAALRLASIFFVLSGMGCAVAPGWWCLIGFRIIGGLAVGISCVVCPMYVAEISPARLRGRLVLMFQMNIVVGILLAYISNALVSPFNFGDEWRWKLGAETLPALIFLVSLFGLPQSPRWLAKRNRMVEARKVLTYVGESEPEKRLNEICGTVAQGSSEPLWQMKYRKPMLIGFALIFFNNMAGISAVMNYLNDIFRLAHFSKSASDMGAVLVGFLNFIFTILAMFLIDRLGRRKLLLIGAMGLAPCLAAMAGIFHYQRSQNLLIWLLGVYIAFFAISQGAVVWVYMSEIFPNSIRGRGEAVTSFISMLIGALVAQMYPLMRSVSVAFPFLVFSVMMVFQFVVVWFCFPETRGVTLEEIQRKLGIYEARQQSA
jgi:sugar porter (SP) family MFS transporter